MISFEDSDFRSIDKLPIKWRWTDSRWNKLPDDALKSIQPLVETKASELCQYSLCFHNQSGLNESLFENIKQVDASGEASEIKQWLLGCSSNLNQKVIVSWNNENAVLVQWKVFCEFWDDFCYPSSDDVAIFPLTEEWMLFYGHKEVFVFGKRSVS
ncbi:MAG TPA: hypothetical protein VF540_13440 [Segetibacter sp.]|jgi:hypothetical protein